jgi:hypothetical protein
MVLLSLFIIGGVPIESIHLTSFETGSRTGEGRPSPLSFRARAEARPARLKQPAGNRPRTAGGWAAIRRAARLGS